MQKHQRLFLYVFSLLGLLLIRPGTLCAQNYVEKFDSGRIDWSNGIIEAVGVGTPPLNPINQAQARAIARKKAVYAARQNLYRAIERIQVDSTACIKDFVDGDGAIRGEIENFLQESDVVDTTYLDGDSVKVTLAVNITGSFLDMMLPESIQRIRPIRQSPQPNQPEKDAYTGLLVDGRGLRVSPAMVLRVMDEDGNEVYGTEFMSREYAVRSGTAGYVKDLAAGAVDDRVGRNPLTVKGIRTAQAGACDIVISNADASRVKETASNLGFLQKCRVVVVVD